MDSQAGPATPKSRGCLLKNSTADHKNNFVPPSACTSVDIIHLRSKHLSTPDILNLLSQTDRLSPVPFASILSAAALQEDLDSSIIFEYVWKNIITSITSPILRTSDQNYGSASTKLSCLERTCPVHAEQET